MTKRKTTRKVKLVCPKCGKVFYRLPLRGFLTPTGRYKSFCETTGKMVYITPIKRKKL